MISYNDKQGLDPGSTINCLLSPASPSGDQGAHFTPEQSLEYKQESKRGARGGTVKHCEAT